GQDGRLPGARRRGVPDGHWGRPASRLRAARARARRGGGGADRGRVDRPLQDGLRRRRDLRRKRQLMPQPNMQQMLKQVQKMQQDMMAAQEQLKDEIVEASAGGGMVTVKVTGDLVVKEVRIDPAAVDPDDVELLQDMVTAAVNQAVDQAQQLA